MADTDKAWLQLKSRENSFFCNFIVNCPIVLHFYTKLDGFDDVLCAKYQNDWTNDEVVMDKREFSRFDFEMNFGQISYTATNPTTFSYASPLWRLRVH